MPHPRIPGFAALKRAAEASQDHPPETKDKGITLVESTSLRSIKTDKSSRLRVVNNSPGGGRQENVVAKVPGLEGTYAAVVDNSESLMEAYKMLPRGKISVIFAVPPNGSGASMTSTEIPWSVLKAGEDEAAAIPDTPDNENDGAQALEDDDETVVGDDETVVGEDHSPKKGAREEVNETSPQPTTTNQPATELEVPYPDLVGLII
ncbi:hypothetical protein H9Q69_001291 [Fusarium xylarioides]|uniref:Uncharacterized protein n=1 Tax=Fusarium xylarioides TaxID=221167 RepID=A0A9P7HYS8_9HYPO|nr:hypothetical protein H9Q70_006489 [Fusarium xylarioides]KAG5769987.1 hypothetical protein H9Q72_002982 [Fusarium xylarioides]KAG5779687.1 hypothetical protein H9Q73_006665 [Fusarium xylarioides]KAG5799661.1 hypothetical protein H9Q69_001291 [Fusarium xylarioides]KAG5814414.1 hypothetical protein H9Q71_003200 [Fusarium xylarioides]